MRIPTRVLLAMACTFLVAPACDTMEQEPGFGAPDGAIRPRCLGPDCLNTSLLGDFEASNLPMIPDVQVANARGDATLEWIAGEVQDPVSQDWYPIKNLDFGPTGELKVVVSGLGVLTGADVVGAWWDIEVTPADTQIPPFVGTFSVHSYSPEVNAQYGVTVHNYLLVTDLAPSAGQHDDMKASEWKGVKGSKTVYTMCPHDAESPSGPVAYSSVFVHGTRLDIDAPDLPQLSSAWASAFAACRASAGSKPLQYKGITAATNGTRSFGIEGYNATMLAYRAQFDGYTMTRPNLPLFMKDLVNPNPLFDDFSAPSIGPEAAYDDVSGATCRGVGPAVPTGGLHRNTVDYPDGPNGVLPGWTDLPPCTVAQLPTYGMVGVQVSLPPP